MWIQSKSQSETSTALTRGTKATIQERARLLGREQRPITCAATREPLRGTVEHQLKLPPLLLPTKVAVPKSAPKPVAVPSQFTGLRTLPAGPGVRMEVIDFNEYSPNVLPDASRHMRP